MTMLSTWVEALEVASLKEGRLSYARLGFSAIFLLA